MLAERILVLEGPKGTAIQSLGLSEADFRGDLSATIRATSRATTTSSV